MRREPVQERGRNRLELLLSAAERVILEKGLDGYSVRQVLRETDTNIATFYQYFPTREALARSVIERHTAQLSSLVSAAFAGADPTDIRSSLAKVQAAIVDYYRANPVTSRIWPGVHADLALGAMDTSDTEHNYEAIREFFVRACPNADAARLDAVARLAAFTAGQLYRHALELPEEKQNALLAEYHDMICSTLERLRDD